MAIFEYIQSNQNFDYLGKFSAKYCLSKSGKLIKTSQISYLRITQSIKILGDCVTVQPLIFFRSLILVCN